MLSKSAQAYLQDIIDNNRWDAFGVPAVFEQLVEQSRLNSQKAFEVPSYLSERVAVETHYDALGNPCVVLSPKEGTSDKAVLYTHGGGFIMQIDQPHWNYCLRLVEEAHFTVYTSIYPLYPTASYPEAYAAVVSAYQLALETFSAENIVFMGDSAGGHLALGLAQYARIADLPQPRCVVAFSPMIDFCEEVPIAEKEALASADPMLGLYGIREIARLWGGEEAASAQFPPCLLQGPFDDLAPMLVICGGREVLLPEIKAFVTRAEEAGAHISFEIYNEFWHDFPLAPIDEADEVFAEVLAFIDGAK